MSEIDNAKDLFKAGMVAFASNEFEKSVDLFTRTIDLNNDSPLALVSRGAAYLKQDMVAQALDDFNHATRIDPDYARAYHMRGLVSETRGDHASALADFDRAIELDPEYAAAYYSRATLHAKLDNPDKAQADIEMVTHLGNRNIALFMNDNNVWRTEHMRVEDAIETELQR